MTSECVRTDSILPRGAGLEHGRCKQSIFSLSIFGTLVEWLSFQRLHFCSDFVTVFFIFFVYARATIRCYRFFNFDLGKKLCFVKSDQVGFLLFVVCFIMETLQAEASLQGIQVNHKLLPK